MTEQYTKSERVLNGEIRGILSYMRQVVRLRNRNVESRLDDRKKLGDTKGLRLKFEDHYVIAVAEKPLHQTVDVIIQHELRHVLEFEIEKFRKKGVPLKYNGKILKEEEKFLVNNNIELRD